MKIELVSITAQPEKIIVMCGRVSHGSTSQIDEDSERAFIRMLINKGHLSVLEHASATFRVSSISRAMTHQLVRHRIASYTQRSQRYVKELEIEMVTPKSIAENPRAQQLFLDTINHCRENYANLLAMGIANEDARYVLPNASATDIMITANFREWRHIIELRGNKNAQWEIREFAIRVLELLKEKAPTVFEDYKIDYKEMVIQ